MQYKVPQNITMEDRIAGPFTLVQFSIMIVGGLIAFIVNSISIIAPLNRILALVLALLTFVIAAGKFNDQPMYKFFRYFILFLITPRTRVSHKMGQEVQLIRPKHQTVKKEETHAAKHVSKADIARLAVVLDSRGNTANPPSNSPR